jgi:hypothetical protein
MGQYLEMAGPDFFNAQLNIGNQKWANVEILKIIRLVFAQS